MSSEIGNPTRSPRDRSRNHPHPRTWRCFKEKYHHGTVVAESIRRGLEIVAERGPMALTLRGLARELGISPAGLVYYFGNRSGLRAAVANAAADRMRPFSVFRSGGMQSSAALRQNAEEWVAFAAKNPNLYRLVFGEGWRHGASQTLPRWECVNSIDRVANIGQMSGHIRQGHPRELGWTFFSAIHGLAFSRADGVAPAEKVGAIIDRHVASLAADPGSGVKKSAFTGRKRTPRA